MRCRCCVRKHAQGRVCGATQLSELVSVCVWEEGGICVCVTICIHIYMYVYIYI